MITLQQHLAPGAPKRILALDGGGIRGAFSLGYLERMEDVLRRQHGDDPAFRLCDYFDLIGGTSTGAIIAACLAIGMNTADIRDLYLKLGGKIFSRQNKWWNIFQPGRFLKAGYNSEPLDEALQEAFKDYTLGSTEIRTGLCIITKRADTNSLWPLNNHPDDKYFDSEHGANKDIALWKAVRASAAAPSYFLPQMVAVGGGMPTAAFVDGGVSMANNPALQLLMVATLKSYPFKWKWGAENMLLVSIGTGMGRWQSNPNNVSKNNLLKWAKELPDMFMQDASWHNQMILQWLSKSATPWHIDDHVGDLSGEDHPMDPQQQSLLTYLRYNLWLDADTLNATMQGKYGEYDSKRCAQLLEMSHAANRFELYDIGVAAAAMQLKADHFPAPFKNR